MRKKLILLISLILLGSSLVFSDTVSFKFNYFVPRANSDLWTDEFDLMDFDKSSFHSTSMGFSYEYFLRQEISFLISIDSYSKKKRGDYMDYVGDTIDEEDWAFDYGSGFAVQHTFDISITSLQLSGKLTPLGRRERLIPYIGAGIGLYLWHLRIFGDWIVFSESELFYDSDIDDYVIGYPIYFANAREDNKLSFGYHAFGGVMIPVTNRLSVDIEFKYNFVDGDLTEDFEGWEPFDLSSYQIALGISYWF